VFRWGYVNTEKCSIFLGSFKCTGLGVRFYICKAWGLISDMVPLTWSSVCNTDLPTDWVKITRPLLATRWSTQCNNWSLVVKLYSPKPIYTWFKTIMKNWILCSMPWLAKKKSFPSIKHKLFCVVLLYVHSICSRNPCCSQPIHTLYSHFIIMATLLWCEQKLNLSFSYLKNPFNTLGKRYQ